MAFEDHRAHPRANLRWPVSVQRGGEVTEGVTKDISEGGAYVCCAKPLGPNEVLDMVINAPDKLLNVKAEVVWASMSGLDDDLTTVQMRDYSNNSQINTYTAIPAQIKGIEYKNDGAIARPTITIANATTAFSAAVGTIDYQTLLGLKFIRRTTLKKYLYGESGDASPPVEFSRDVYTIDRIKSRTKQKWYLDLPMRN